MSSSAAAMNIMDKYQTLTRGIEEARRESNLLQEEKENLLRHVENLCDEREIMTSHLAQARTEAADLQRRIGDISNDDDDDSKNSSDITVARNLQQQQVDFLKEHIAQQRRDFCETSRTFRSTVKRLKLTSTECGLEMAVSHAFLQVHGVPVDEEREDLVVVETQEYDASTRDALEQEWHNDALSDETMTPYRRAFEARQDAEHAYNDVVVARSEAMDRANKRHDKHVTLQGQLERIRGTVSDLEQELSQLQEDTSEIDAMTASYRQRAQQQQQQQRSTVQHQVQQPRTSAPAAAASTRAPHNPYARRTDTRTVLERQHPHLAGRVRLDRQFGASSVGIIGGAEVVHPTTTIVEDDSSDDDIDDFVAFRRN